MASRCSGAEYWDSLVKSCRPCLLVCKKEPPTGRCAKFCVLSQCQERPGHFYDGLLKRCSRCADVCSGQSASCPQPCQKSTSSSAAAATGLQPRPLQTLPPAGPSAPGALDSGVLLYSLLAFSVLLLLSSLGLALRVFLRESRSRSGQDGAKCEEDDRSKGLRLPLEELQRESDSSESPTPTENCACVHCFPDVRGPGPHGPIRASRLTQEAGSLWVRTGGTDWAERDLYTSGPRPGTEPRAVWTRDG